MTPHLHIQQTSTKRGCCQVLLPAPDVVLPPGHFSYCSNAETRFLFIRTLTVIAAFFAFGLSATLNSFLCSPNSIFSIPSCFDFSFEAPVTVENKSHALIQTLCCLKISSTWLSPLFLNSVLTEIFRTQTSCSQILCQNCNTSSLYPSFQQSSFHLRNPMSQASTATFFSAFRSSTLSPEWPSKFCLQHCRFFQSSILYSSSFILPNSKDPQGCTMKFATAPTLPLYLFVMIFCIILLWQKSMTKST